MTSLTRRLLQYRARQLCGGMATMCQKIHFLATVGTTMAHRPVEKDDRQPLPRLYHNICSTTLGQVSHDTMGICEHDSVTFLGRSSGAHGPGFLKKDEDSTSSLVHENGNGQWGDSLNLLCNTPSLLSCHQTMSRPERTLSGEGGYYSTTRTLCGTRILKYYTQHVRCISWTGLITVTY